MRPLVSEWQNWATKRVHTAAGEGCVCGGGGGWAVQLPELCGLVAIGEEDGLTADAKAPKGADAQEWARLGGYR